VLKNVWKAFGICLGGFVGSLGCVSGVPVSERYQDRWK